MVIGFIHVATDRTSSDVRDRAGIRASTRAVSSVERRVRARAVVAALVLLASTLRSIDAGAEPATVRRLAFDTRIDAAVVGVGAVWLAAAEIMKADLAPETCRWCSRKADGTSDLNVVDRRIRLALKWDDVRTADLASSGIAFALMPLGAIGGLVGSAAHDGAIEEAPVDALITAEATILAADLNQLVKFVAARERPFVHHLPRAPNGVRPLTDSPSDDNLSFYSGHTNLAFALAASSSTVAFLRGYRLAPLILGIGAAAACSVGYLRIAADKHYFSDVIVGAALGSLVGAFVPLVFHPATEVLQLGAAPQALSVAPGTMSTPFLLEGVW